MQRLAPAKINLFLKIISNREDGYHNLLSLFQTISLYDKIKVSSIPKDKIIVNSNISTIRGKNNLCYKVAELIKKKYNIKKGIKIYIEKRIPIGSGLGGASSDAECVLECLCKIFNLKLSKDEMIDICYQIGKDVVYFLYKGLCIVESLGEKITKLKCKNPIWFVILYPNRILLTKDVYKTYDSINKKLSIPYDKNDIIYFVKKDELEKILYNDLEIAAKKLFPLLKKIKQTMRELGAKNVSMSGSGSALFTLFRSKKEAEKFKEKIKKKFKKYKIFLAKNIN